MKRSQALAAGLAQWPRQALLALVRGYRLLLKPWVGNVCRFEPSCSAYALQALQRHGALAGSALTAGRILRCHPWCAGGHDPVPENLRLRLLPSGRAGLFTRFGPGSTPPDARSSFRKPPP